MPGRTYVNADGSLRDAVRPARAERHGVDRERVAALLAEVRERGYVVIPELVPRETMAAIKDVARPFLTCDGRNEFEGARVREGCDA